MSRHGKVVVAMSGGVDSSVAACLLKEQGYECVGVFMRSGTGPNEPLPPGGLERPAQRPAATGGPPRRLRHGCCSALDAGDARAVAGRLGIPFYVLDFSEDFERLIDYFVDEYARARTPNPCILCNLRLKFGKLLRYADLLDAQYVATGHYARILPRDDRLLLARALDRQKDQSYALFGIRRADLSRCLLPVGSLPGKKEVREIAARLNLRVHDKPESQEICFVPDGDYRRLVRARRPETWRSGEVRDLAGRTLGTHEGLANFTIGQRHGLGVAAGTPLYVVKLDVPSNTVIVAPREALLSTGLVADQMNWLVDPPAEGETQPAEVQIRYSHAPAGASIRRLADGTLEATFAQPQPAVTPGQAAVLYNDDIVLGGGWIRSTWPTASATAL